ECCPAPGFACVLYTRKSSCCVPIRTNTGDAPITPWPRTRLPGSPFMLSAGLYCLKHTSGLLLGVNGPVGDLLCAVPMHLAPFAGLLSLPAGWPFVPVSAAAK